MDLKGIQKKLKDLRDRIRDEGRLTPASEAELRTILNDTLTTATDELETIQTKLSATLAVRAGNDNMALSDEQKKRLRIVEKAGTGSYAVH